MLPPKWFGMLGPIPNCLNSGGGPIMLLSPIAKSILRVGGKFYIVMEAGEAMGPYKGTRWPMLAKFTAVEPYSKLSYDAKAWTEGQSKDDTLISQTTEVTLTEKNGKTALKIVAIIHETGSAARMAVEGMEAGFTQQLAKLDNFLAAHK